MGLVGEAECLAHGDLVVDTLVGSGKSSEV